MHLMTTGLVACFIAVMVVGSERPAQTALTQSQSAPQGSPPASTANSGDSTPFGISEVGVERAGGEPSSPAYTLAIRSDGTFRYHGERGVTRLGDSTGRIPASSFARLAAFIADSSFKSIKGVEHAGASGAARMTTSVVMSGERHTVAWEDPGAPVRLWAINEIIESLMARAEWDDRALSETGITEITIERTGCLGVCPVYTAVIQIDGTVRYHGKWNVARRGDHTGKLPPYAIPLLVQFIADSDFCSIRSEVGFEDDAPTTTTSILANGTRTSIRCIGESGNLRLWAVNALIDQVIAEAKWTSKEAKVPGAK